MGQSITLLCFFFFFFDLIITSNIILRKFPGIKYPVNCISSLLSFRKCQTSNSSYERRRRQNRSHVGIFDTLKDSTRVLLLVHGHIAFIYQFLDLW
jgi:hypothetical protein